MPRKFRLSTVCLERLNGCTPHDEFGDGATPCRLADEHGDSQELRSSHAMDHSRRAEELGAAGDEDAADIHYALVANMARAAG